MTRIYLDHAATTPVIAPARDAFLRGLDCWSNPNSPHGEGRGCRKLLEEARATLKDVLGWRHDVIFTSGASESVEIAGKRAVPERRIYGATEHAIVPFAMGDSAQVVTVGTDGLIDEAALAGLLAEGPALVAIQQVNNETGIVQPLERIATIVHEAGSLLLADCAQGASKMPLPDADMIAICGHKLGGPPGVGALLVKDLSMLSPCGGGQEKGYRRGTQDVPGALAFAAALAARPYDMERMAVLRERLEAGVKAAGGVIIGGDAPRAATIGAISLPGGASAAMLVQLDLAGIAVSAGSACSSGKAKASHVLAAMDLDPVVAAGYLRTSFGPDTSDADVDGFLSEFGRIAERVREQKAA
jgi:cysteine desulfurase